jgi:hypothetical protein
MAIVTTIFCYFDLHWPSLDISLGSNAERPRRTKVQSHAVIKPVSCDVLDFRCALST